MYVPNRVVGILGFVSGGKMGAVTLLDVSLATVPFVLQEKITRNMWVSHLQNNTHKIL